MIQVSGGAFDFEVLLVASAVLMLVTIVLWVAAKFAFGLPTIPFLGSPFSMPHAIRVKVAYDSDFSSKLNSSETNSLSDASGPKSVESNSKNSRVQYDAMTTIAVRSASVRTIASNCVLFVGGVLSAGCLCAALLKFAL